MAVPFIALIAVIVPVALAKAGKKSEGRDLVEPGTGHYLGNSVGKS